MVEVVSLLISSLMIIYVVFDLYGKSRKDNKRPSVHIPYHPIKGGLKKPDNEDGRFVLYSPYDIILSSFSERGGWTQRIDLEFRVEIPVGNIGLVSHYPDCFLDTTDEINLLAGSNTVILNEGWSGNLYLDIWNRHSVEVGSVRKGSKLAVLYLIPVLSIDAHNLIREI